MNKDDPESITRETHVNDALVQRSFPFKDVTNCIGKMLPTVRQIYSVRLALKINVPVEAVVVKYRFFHGSISRSVMLTLHVWTHLLH